MIEIDDEIIYPTFTPKCKYEPMKHQIDALRFMRDREQDSVITGGILALEMGLGKTFTSLYHISTQGGQTLIVCPKTAIYTWVEEIKKFYGNTLSYFIFRKDNKRVASITKEEISKYNVVITNYEYLRNMVKEKNIFNRVAMRDFNGNVFGANSPLNPPLRDVKGESLMYSIKWDRIICDESHNFANYKTALWQSIISLCGERKFCLSGTPIKNYADDLYGQYKFLGYYEPEFNVKNFHNLNLSKYICYSNYKKAGIKLPESTHIRVECPLEGEQEEIYNIFLNKTTKAFKNFSNKAETFASVFTLFLRLRQICIAPYSITPQSTNKKINEKDYESTLEMIYSLPEEIQTWINDKNSSAGLKSSKIEKATGIIKSIPKGEKTVVFTMFKRVIDLMKERLTKEGKKVITIDGSVTGNSRDASLNSFKNDDYDVLLISYKIGAESLNLCEATNIILLEPWWSPSIIEQSKARIHRIGQDKSVKIYELYVPNDDNLKSIETAIVEICDKKRNIANEYLTTGKCENGSKLDAKTLGEILKVAYSSK